MWAFSVPLIKSYSRNHKIWNFKIFTHKKNASNTHHNFPCRSRNFFNCQISWNLNQIYRKFCSFSKFNIPNLFVPINIKDDMSTVSWVIKRVAFLLSYRRTGSVAHFDSNWKLKLCRSCEYCWTCSQSVFSKSLYSGSIHSHRVCSGWCSRCYTMAYSFHAEKVRFLTLFCWYLAICEYSVNVVFPFSST